MIRKLMATSALALLVSSGAIAQTSTTVPADPAQQTQPTAEVPMVVKADGQLASNIIGESVYNGAGDEAENIGDVNDIVFDADGNIQAVVIGVGGFLGLGEKHVAIEYDLVKWAERDGDRWLVVETTAEALKAQPEFDRMAYQPVPADADVAETKPATADDLATAETAEPAEAMPVEDKTAEAPADQDVAMAPKDETAKTEDRVTDDQNTAASPLEDPAKATDATETAAIDRSSLQPLASDQIRAEELIGTTVYGVGDDHIGEIGDVVLSQDGNVDAIIVDVGGFLGIGEKEVAIGMDNLEFMSDGEGNRYLYTAFTQEELEAQPAYEEAAYAERRDEMRMIVPQ